MIEVTRRDEATSKRREHGTCALAVAAKRCFEADGVIISLSKAYVVRGKKAFRYDLPESAAREVISFDRGSGFAPGTYNLNKPAVPLGVRHKRGKNRNESKRGTKAKNVHHMTSGIRTVLGSKEIR